MNVQRIAAPSALAASLAASLAVVLAACGLDRTETIVESTLPATTESDGPLGAGTGAIGTVEVTVTHPDIEPTVYTVGCMGDTFPVTPAIDGVVGEKACDLLADPAIFTLLTEGPPADQMCTELYGGPDEAHIVGEVNGVAVDTTITRSNGCEIAAWESMIGLLPAPIGAT